MPTRAARREDRVLVRGGRRHHRKTYSRAEFRIGLVCLWALALVGGWVAWRGAHPDPALFEAPLSVGDSAPPADRGPLPTELAATDWTEGAVATFGFDDVYEKINGREGYYKQFGFRRLWFVPLTRGEDPATAVDVEVYDLTESANALGAALGELPEGASPEMSERGLTLLDRNALFLTRGPLYIRAIGSDESPSVVAQLEHLRSRLDTAPTVEPLPFAWALFSGELGIDPGSISYVKENAFSFGFARDVYVALLTDESEIFVVAAETPAGARDLADRFNEGFSGYGEAIDRSLGVQWSKDRYISTVSGAKPVGTFTIGVRGAPDLPAAEAALRDLQRSVLTLPGSES